MTPNSSGISNTNSDSRSSEKEIIVYHIGGEGGDYGPISEVVTKMKNHVRLVVFEARNDTADLRAKETMSKDGYRVTLINKGIDEAAGVANFYVNKFPLSSSLLAVSPLAAMEDPVYPNCRTWGEDAALDHIIQVETTSLDEIVVSGVVPPPDIISIDAQGAELRILRGARKALEQALCVVSEVEFYEIYDGQGPFDEQMMLLTQGGFRLVNLLNQQTWHPGPAAGVGFLTVAEALFIRCAKDLPDPKILSKRGYVPFTQLTDGQILRLAGIASALRVHSYAVQLAGVLKDRAPELYESMRHDPGYAQTVLNHETIESHMYLYHADPKAFMHGL